MGWILPIIIIVFWQISSLKGFIPSDSLPSPFEIVQTIYLMVITGELWGHVFITIVRVLIGFLIGAVTGTLAGAITGYSQTARSLFDPLLQSLRNIPSMAWVPLFLLWFGIFEESKITLIATGVFFPVYLTLSTGIEQVDKKLIEVGKVFSLSARQQIVQIIMPAAFPAWITALRNGLGLGWMFVVAAELMGASQGLGFLMYDAQQTSRANVILACIVLFAVLGKLSDWALASIGRYSLRYQRV